MGILTENQISRMADLEFITELVDIIVNGIHTASPSTLDKLYRDRDKSFSDKKFVDDQIRFGLGEIIDMLDIHKTKIMSRGNAYTLFAALVAVKFPGAVARADLQSSEVQNPFVDRADILTNLTTLSDALENEDENFAEFVTAARQGTNTANNRKTRFKWFHRALTSKSL